ncbi:MAG: PaaI family thioesterase [Deltaproteobacteria bacterium]|nr:PaaI family thioesterase [Deltaproteobacteria bacterium]
MLMMGRQVLADQPFSVLIGAELLKFSVGFAELKVPVKRELQQQHGFLHGGVVSYAADNALTYVGGSVLGPGVVTSEFKINYVRPALGDFIVARAHAVYVGKNQAVCRCDVFAVKDGQESLCAVAQGTITKIGRSESRADG